MASFEHLRAVALIVYEAVEALYNDILPVRAVTSSWDLTDIDDNLPDEGDVKATLETYEDITKLPVTLNAALQDVRATTGTPPEGLFSLPATVFPIVFSLDGPLMAPVELGSQGFGVNLKIERITLFCGDTGSGGNDLTADLQNQSGSLFSTIPVISANSGMNQLFIVPAADISTDSILAGDILTGSLVSKPDASKTAILTLWVKVE